MTDETPRPKLSDRLIHLAHSRQLLPVLLLVATVESCGLPFPYEAVFLALCLAVRDRILSLIIVSVLGSALGGTIIYLIGANLFDPMIEFLGLEAQIATYLDGFDARARSLLFLVGLTPAPAIPIILIAGATGFPFLEFLGIFSGSRLIRFGILGGLVFLFGDQIVETWSKLPKPARRILSVLVIAAVIYWFVSGLT